MPTDELTKKLMGKVAFVTGGSRGIGAAIAKRLAQDGGAVARSHVDIRRSQQRFHTQISWLDPHHSFSFVDHYDPQNTHHGLEGVDALRRSDAVRLTATAARSLTANTGTGAEVLIWEINQDLEI